MATKNGQLYDEQIRPLVDQVIKLCEENGMPYIMTFSTGYDAETDTADLCMSWCIDPAHKPPMDMVLAAQVLGRKN